MNEEKFIKKISSICGKEGINNSELIKLKKENLTKDDFISGITNLIEEKRNSRIIELEELKKNETQENIKTITGYINDFNEQLFKKFINKKPSWYKEPSSKVEVTNLNKPNTEIKVSNFPEQKEYPKEIKVTNFPEYPKPLEKVEITNLKEYPEPLKEIQVTNFPKQIDIKKPDWYKEPKDKVEITNFPEQKEYPKEIKITNLQKNVIIENDVSLKEPNWINKLLPDNNIVNKISDSISTVLEKISTTSVGRIIKNKFIVKTEKENPLNVVLVDPVTKNPTGLNVSVSGGGGYQDTIGLKNASEATINPATEDKQDDSITELGKIKNAVEIMDDWDESDKCKVQIKGDDSGLATSAKQDDIITSIEDVETSVDEATTAVDENTTAVEETTTAIETLETSLTEGDELRRNIESKEALELILLELKKINKHFETITDDEIGEDDINIEG